MSTETKVVHNNGLALEYLVFGDGSDVIICLHGHGRPAEDFSFLEHPTRKVISLHLFYHGNSYFPEERIEKEPLRTSEFERLFSMILDQEHVSKFHLFAFSQGGRFTLSVIPHFAERIQTVTLIAPDGMDNNSFYNWSSRQRWARALFRKYEKDPSRLIKLSKVAEKLRLMRPKVRAFVDEFASDSRSFKRASLTWRAFRNVQPHNNKIKKALKDHSIPIIIIMGTYDQVIRPQQAYMFAEKIGQKGCVVEVPNGHNFFKKTAIAKFVHLLPFA